MKLIGLVTSFEILRGSERGVWKCVMEGVISTVLPGWFRRFQHNESLVFPTVFFKKVLDNPI
ncbi:MAG: hypothetical protein HW412_398 [Bacteroidetes bacterium]|nr:hypothetical protein [Bacteroidota bacterium]